MSKRMMTIHIDNELADRLYRRADRGDRSAFIRGAIKMRLDLEPVAGRDDAQALAEKVWDLLEIIDG